MDDGQFHLKTTWSVVSEPAGIFVEERTTESASLVRFGPMPEDIVKPFIAERRDLYEAIFRKHEKRLLPIAHASV